MVEPAGFEPATSSMPSRRAPNCATAPPKEEPLLVAFIAPCRYDGQTNDRDSFARPPATLDHPDSLLWASEPGIADGKRECGVVARIMRAQAGARQMAEFDFKQQGSHLFHENVGAESSL